MRILAIDPGERESAFVLLTDSFETLIEWHRKEANNQLLEIVGDLAEDSSALTFAIEFPHARGMPASNNLFRTTSWVGRFIERYISRVQYPRVPLIIDRKDVKLHHCDSVKAKDSNVRQSIVDRYGGKDVAIGKKKTPGPLYGVRADTWQALAIGLMVADRRGDAEWIRQREMNW